MRYMHWYYFMGDVKNEKIKREKHSPISMFSTASARVTSGLAIVLSNGYKLQTTTSMWS